MGYYTEFTLEIVDGPEVEQATCPHCNSEVFLDSLIIDQIRKENERIAYSLSQITTWYDHEEDMLVISKQYPETTFKLSGEGEENDDIWAKFFKKGKVVERRAEVKLDAKIKDSDFD